MPEHRVKTVGQSRVHNCVGQWYTAIGNKEPPAEECTCKKYIDLKEAEKLVHDGDALEVVMSRDRAPDKICPWCLGDPKVKNCANCKGKGILQGGVTDETYHETDIVLSVAKRTPRVATAEKEHLLRAYVPSWVQEIVASVERETQAKKFKDDNVAPQEMLAAKRRIEEYGRLTEDARRFIGKGIAEPRRDLCENTKCPTFGMKVMKNTNKGRVFLIVPEPENNKELGTGRDYDYGRTI